MPALIPYSKQTITRQDIKEVVDVLKSEMLTQGPRVSILEKKISKRINSKYAICVNSATSALHIACLAIGFKKNDILWTSPNTFVASANCALHLDGKVDFVDIDYNTGNIDIQLLEKKLKYAKKKNILPKILIPVHFGGTPTEQDKIFKLSKKYKFKIIEDASHSLGAKYKKENVGSCKWSNITVFSLHPVKIITSGEGGIATTNDRNLYNKMQMFKNHGITKNKKSFLYKTNNEWYYEQQKLGFNFRMNEISAGLAISQLKKLNKFVKARNDIAKFYDNNLDKTNLILPFRNKNFLSPYHLYNIKIKGKNFEKIHKKLFKLLRKKNFFAQVHYLPVHLQPYFRKKFNFKKNSFINAERHAKSSISLPIYPSISKKILYKITNLINNFITSNV